MKDSRKESQPSTRTKSLEILAKVSGLLGGPPPPAQHLHLHGADLTADEQMRMLRMRRRQHDDDAAATEG